MSIVGDIAAASIKPFLNANGKVDQWNAEIATQIKAAAEAELFARALDQDIGVIVKRDGYAGYVGRLSFYNKTPRGGQLLLDGAEPVSKAEAYRLRGTETGATPGFYDNEREEEIKRELAHAYKKNRFRPSPG